MKCLKKIIALGMCMGGMSALACRAVLPDMELQQCSAFSFYRRVGLNDHILGTIEGLSLLRCLLSGSELVAETVSSGLEDPTKRHLNEDYVVEVYITYAAAGRLCEMKKLIEDNKKKLYDLTLLAFERSLSIQRKMAHYSVLSELDKSEIKDTTLYDLYPVFRRGIRRRLGSKQVKRVFHATSCSTLGMNKNLENLSSALRKRGRRVLTGASFTNNATVSSD